MGKGGCTLWLAHTISEVRFKKKKGLLDLVGVVNWLLFCHLSQANLMQKLQKLEGFQIATKSAMCFFS